MPMNAHIGFRFDLAPLKHFVRELEGQLATGRSGPFNRMLKRWGHRYLSFTDRRFTRMSRGGWQGLAESTKRRRRRARRGHTGARSMAVLVDTGTLRGALKPGANGNMLRVISGGFVRAGFDQTSRHPGGPATIGDIARFHNEGLGTNPERRILVPPDTPTVAGMKEDLRRAVGEQGRISGGR